MGRIYQQTFIDTYTKVAFAKLYDRKTALVAADMLNDRVIPFYEEYGVRLLRVLTDREQNTAVPANIMNTNFPWLWKISTIAGRKREAHKPMVSANDLTDLFRMNFYAIAFRKKIYNTL